MGIKQKGFTIVELLIVIVIIGILATLVISTFANAQKQAANSATKASVNAWSKLIKIFIEQQGQQPLAAYACLGKASSEFAAENGMSANVCQAGYPSAPSYNETYDDLLKDELEGALSGTAKLPSGKLAIMKGTVQGTPITSRGIVYKNGPGLQYYLNGKNADCSPGNASASATNDTMTMCFLDLVVQ